MKFIEQRCPWCGDDPLYVKYHDEEWGRPIEDDKKLFELLLLESAQAGLALIISGTTIFATPSSKQPASSTTT